MCRMRVVEPRVYSLIKYYEVFDLAVAGGIDLP